MADINVERKRTSVWPWIIGLIAVALLIWVLAGLFGDDQEAAVGQGSMDESGQYAPDTPSLAVGLRVT